MRYAWIIATIDNRVPMLTLEIAMKILQKHEHSKEKYYNIEGKFDFQNENDAYSI